MPNVAPALVPVTPEQRARAAFLLAQPERMRCYAEADAAARRAVTLALAAGDGEELTDALGDLGVRLGVACGYCREEIRAGDGYCSRECWQADRGGDA